MQLDQCPSNFGYDCETDRLYQKFTLKQIAESRPQQILQIILEKDNIIQAFSQSITKFKAEQLKTKKLISSLQEKIQKNLPAATNTSNTFMIPSEFKTLFITFMTSTVPSVLYDFTENPKIYSTLLKVILQGVYSKLQSILQEKTENIRTILLSQSFSKQVENKQQTLVEDQNIRGQIGYHLLSFLQKYNERIFPSDLNKIGSGKQRTDEEVDEQDKKSEALFQVLYSAELGISQSIRQKIQTLNSEQTQISDQLKQFCLQLYQICVYMILQQQPWQFVFDSETQTVSGNEWAEVLFTKKQCTCIDGFVKEGSEVEMALKGLRRKENSLKEYHYHPNIKNFVLPSNKDEQKMPLDFQFKANILFLRQFNSKYNLTPSIQSNKKTPHKTRDIIETNQPQQSFNLDYSPSLHQNLPKKGTGSSINLVKNNQSLPPINNPKIPSEDSFKLEAISRTQNSEIIQSSLVHNQSPLIKNQSNGIIDLTETYTIKRKLSHKQQFSNQHEDKQNVNQNLNAIKQDKKLSTNSKKGKSFIQKNIIKKSKKEKNNSTVDLILQKHKLNQKDQPKTNMQIQSEAPKKKHEQFPLTRQILKSSKKRAVKSNRKCSVGKIISQSTQMTGLTTNTHAKQKISLSQHSTVVMKELCVTKPLKDNYLIEGGFKVDMQNKQNMSPFVGHMYEKLITRPKKSTKLNRQEEKPLVVGVHKQDRPLALRAFQNNCMVGRLREKYLVG